MIPEEHVFEEMKRRIHLTNAINSIIHLHIMARERVHLKRGETQDFILKKLNLLKNPAICKLINECMNTAGYKSGIIRGDQIYKNACLFIVG